jgi:hypothetical protein
MRRGVVLLRSSHQQPEIVDRPSDHILENLCG